MRVNAFKTCRSRWGVRTACGWDRHFRIRPNRWDRHFRIRQFRILTGSAACINRLLQISVRAWQSALQEAVGVLLQVLWSEPSGSMRGWFTVPVPQPAKTLPAGS